MIACLITCLVVGYVVGRFHVAFEGWLQERRAIRQYRRDIGIDR